MEGGGGRSLGSSGFVRGIQDPIYKFPSSSLQVSLSSDSLQSELREISSPPARGRGEVKAVLAKEAIEVVSGDKTGFYNCLFVVTKATGSWRPVLDVSALNKYVLLTKFSMESPNRF